MDKNFKMTFGVGYDQADTLIQIDQLEARKERLKKAIDDKAAGRPYDMLLLQPAFFPPIKKCKPGFDIGQVDSFMDALRKEVKALELKLV
ncbi:hypothetical protein [Ruminococcus sp. NK3A76]|uniref:hypothetical protein n=1 Tax=Ruminococcus sp. NK3A76 TaxID=877411 RepID=UPI00048AF620|nr:hypothetical protein [Ruminococcus sp. NK3A76]